MSLKKNNEDLQDSKRHIGVSLMAVESYQSLKQMAYRLHGFVLDTPTPPHKGDLSKITHAKDYGTRLIHFFQEMEMQHICSALIVLIIITTVTNYTLFRIFSCSTFLTLMEVQMKCKIND